MGPVFWPSGGLLGRRWRGLAERLGQRLENSVCRQLAGSVPGPWLHYGHVLRALAGGDVAVDQHHHHGLEVRMVEEVGVVPGYLSVVSDPPVVLAQPDAVLQVACERGLVQWRHVVDERVETLGLRLG